jgi:hypothetical protein
MFAIGNLSPAVCHEIFATLTASLPPPPDGDTPDNRARRDEAAMEAVAALHPADAFEARLAAQIVLADALMADSASLAVQHRTDFPTTTRHRAQANSFMREVRASLRELRRMQAERDKALAEMQPAAMERAGWWFREATVPAPAAQADNPDRFASLSEAEQYAVIYPDRARRIRAAGGLPNPLDFDPLEPEQVAAIVTGTSPILLALDRPKELLTA